MGIHTCVCMFVCTCMYRLVYKNMCICNAYVSVCVCVYICMCVYILYMHCACVYVCGGVVDIMYTSTSQVFLNQGAVTVC